MATDYGAGIYLTNKSDVSPAWDMDVTNSGDIRTTSGASELEKDLALSTTIRIGEELGGLNTPAVRNRIRARILDALEDDSRIDTVLSVEVTELDRNSEVVEVVARVNAVEDDNIELVFEAVN